MNTLVSDRMSAPAITQPATTPIPTLVLLLEARSISAVPIVTEGRLAGIVSTTDLLRPIRDGRAETAADRMTRRVVTVRPDDAIEHAARRLVDARVHRVVVVDDDEVVGVLSARDVLEDVRRRRLALPIDRIMTSSVETVDLGDSIDVAVERLAAAKVHGLVVVDGSWPVGVFTHAEALAARRLAPALWSRPVEDIMSYETVCLDTTTPVHRAAAYCMSMNVRRILVVEQRRLVGVLSVVDLVGVLAREARQSERSSPSCEARSG